VRLVESLALAAEKDFGLDLVVLGELMTRARSIPRDEFDLTGQSVRSVTAARRRLAHADRTTDRRPREP
jgi:hypothetical protein